MTERRLSATELSLVRGTAVVRWLTVAWAMLGVAISTEHLRHPVWAWLGIAAAILLTAVWSALVVRQPARLVTASIVMAELALATALLLLDGYVYTDERLQSLPWAFPAAGLIACGIAFGRRWALTAAAVLSVASFLGEGLNDGDPASWGVPASSRAGLYVLTALISGYVAKRLRAAEREISAARAREEVATTLHDGVLQTLAVIQRRSDDPELVQLAHQQDRDLRDFLAGSRSTQPGLSASLRAAVRTFEQRHGGRVDLVIADDVSEPNEAVIAAVAGAVSEALSNVGKHAAATRTVVYVEPDDDAVGDRGLFLSVKDDGTGFDTAEVHERIGMRDSIRSRIESVGGRVEISSRPGRGTEVRLWVR